MSRGLLLVCHAAVLGGCLVGNDLPPQGPVIASQSSNKLALNKLALNKLALNKLALNKLALNSLSNGALQAGLDSPLSEVDQSDPFRDSSDRSTTMIYVARCLVPQGQQLEITVPGSDPGYGGDQYGTPTGGTAVTHVYEGAVGIGMANLEPDGTCGTSCQEWMTSCLLAHVNGLGVEVEISLRGPHATLAPDPSELADFVEQEAGFYGNLFVGQDDDPNKPLTNIYACTGWLWDDAEQTIDTKRICGRPTAAGGSCDGIQVVGYCGARLPGAPLTDGHTCGQQITGDGGTLSGTIFYSDCYRGVSVPIPTPNTFPASAGAPNPHVITTHLRRRCGPSSAGDRCSLNGKVGVCGDDGFCRGFQ